MSEFAPLNPGHVRRVPQAVATGIALATAGVLWIALDAVGGLRGEISDIELLIARAEMAPAVESSSGDALLHSADTHQLSQANVQTALQALAEAQGAEVEVIRAEDVIEAGAFAKLDLSLGGTVPEARLGTFLAGIDALEPVVLVEQLNLRRTRTARGDADRRVAFQMRVHGLARP